jgi:hypothetical protein
MIIAEKFYAQEELKPWNETRKLQLCAIYRDELAGDVVRPRPGRAWGGTGLGRCSGGGWDGEHAPPLPAGSRCATQLDRPDRMARQGDTPSASGGNEGGHVGSGTDTHTRTHTRARMGYWGGCWIGSRRVGRGCGRRSGMGSGFVFARRSNRCVRGLPRGSLISIYLSIWRTTFQGLHRPAIRHVGERLGVWHCSRACSQASSAFAQLRSASQRLYRDR